jgi:hypothetical protein
VLKIYSERDEIWRISWTHQSFGKSDIVTEKVLEVQKPYFMRYKWVAVSQGTYIRRMIEDRAHTVDEVMKTCD